jgi:hypothetical protein
MYAEPLIRDAIQVVEAKMKERGVTGSLYKQVDKDLALAWDWGLEKDRFSKGLGYLMRAWGRLVKAGKFKATELPLK